MRRDRAALLLYLSFLGLSFAAIAVVGYQAVESRRAVLEGELESAARRGLDVAVTHLSRVLSEREAIERQRPYYEYNSLYYEPGTYSNQIALTNTPLWKPETPLIEGYTQLERAAVNEKEIVSCSIPQPPAQDDLQVVPPVGLESKEAKELLGVLLGKRILADFGEPVIRPVAQDVWMYNCDTEEIATNIALANRNDARSQTQLIEQGIESWNTRAGNRPRLEVPVSYTGFCYFGQMVDGQPELVALRSVTVSPPNPLPGKPGRTVLQGYFIDAARLLRDELDLVRSQMAAQHLTLGFCGPVEPEGPSWSVPLGQAVPIRGELAKCLLVATPLGLDWIGEEMQSEKLRFFAVLGMIFLVIALAGYFVARLVRAELELARKKSDFVAAVSHELKTPLTGIRLCADLLEQGWVDDPAKRREYVASIAGEGERLSRLIDNVLSFARLEGGRSYRLELIEGDVRPLVREVVESWRDRFERDGFSLVLSLPDTVPPIVHDPDAFTQILSNLLDNALKYGRLGEGPREIAVSLEADGGKVRLTVADRGPGFAPGVAERCFEPFYRLDDEMTRKTKGTGIGLALVRSLAEAQGASVIAKRRTEGGAAMTVTYRVKSQRP
ncbi:MAG: HAMP domain-containing sensor histidine kinase [Planctomycetota bacterium]